MFLVRRGFGLAWSLLQLIETSDVALTAGRPPDDAGEWVMRLWQREENRRLRTARP